MVLGSRVALDSVGHAFLSGASAETIAQAFAVLTLEQVYGAITFYRAHLKDVDRYLAARKEHFEARRQAARVADPMLYHRLADAARRYQSTS